ncbi:tetratricopeptide repeat protein [Streptomyces polyrhachis]|uniref:Tetratricopeptide repeat protein n=1 Tax=Streptomyces polyrhachis TaxID=1282885 RepID=A0ABW2GH78_9ACTN
MAGGVDTRELRRFVVRIRDDRGRTVGTGVFVAPGWVLTCAHVAGAGADADRVVRVEAADPSVRLAEARWQVVAASPPRAPEAGGAWPYPDLALVRADRAVEHPCALLDPGDPGSEADCQGWGFMQVEGETDPAGSAASFRFEGIGGFQGVTGDYLKLKAGQAAPGLSGAPLVCPERRAVVALASVTRGAGGDLGAWASPVRALLRVDLAREPGTEELAPYAAQLRAANREAVLAEREAWNRVLSRPRPTDPHEGLSRPWGTFVKGVRTSPADLLRADFGVVPYLFRARDLADAVDWCRQPHAMRTAQAAGWGGAGKTRFGVELCQRMQNQGWAAGLLTDGGWRSLGALPVPRLLVVDYAEDGIHGDLRDALEHLRERATDLAPVRVLLLTRKASGAGDVLDQLLRDAPASLSQVLQDHREFPVASTRLTPDEREELYAAARRSFWRRWNDREAPAAPTTAVDLGDERYATPLDVLFEAYDAAVSGADPVPGRTQARPGVERALGHEEKYWQVTARAFAADGSTLLTRAGTARLHAAVALMTLAGAADAEEADALLRLLPEPESGESPALRADLAQWLAQCYEGPLHLNPLRPDRLGEALIIRELLTPPGAHERRMLGPSVLRQVLSLPSDSQVVRTLDVLARMAVYDGATVDAVVDALAESLPELILRAEDRALGTVDRRADRSLAGVLVRLVQPPLMERLVAVDGGNLEYQHDLGVSYERLGDLARDAGERARARGLFERGLEIAERLVAADGGNLEYQRDLSISCNRLGDLARDAGERARARELFERDLEIAERLVAADGGNLQYQRDLSISCNRLGELAREVGERARARELFERGLEIRERLVAADGGNLQYQRDLSISCNRLGELARDAGEGARARELFERGLEIAERLVAADGGNLQYQRDLSISYYWLGELAREVGEGVRARGLFERGLEIRERLVAADGGNLQYQRDLSISYYWLGELAREVGEGVRARGLFERGLEIRERLVAADGGNLQYQRDLSISYERLVVLGQLVPQSAEAVKQWLGRALELRWAVHGRSAQMDTAVDLSYVLFLACMTLDDSTASPRQVVDLLAPFEHAGTLSPHGEELLAWAREADGGSAV